MVAGALDPAESGKQFLQASTQRQDAALVATTEARMLPTLSPGTPRRVAAGTKE